MINRGLIFIFWMMFIHAQDSCEYYINRGLNELNLNKYKSSIVFFNTSIKYCGDKNKAKAFNNMANAYSYMNIPDSSVFYYLKALSIFEKIKDSSNIAKCLKNIGAIYQEIGDNKKAFPYCDKAEKIAVLIGDSAIIADCYNNKGILYEQEGIFSQSLDYYNKAINLYQNMNNNKRLVMVYNNLAVLLKNNHKYSFSEYYYYKSLRLSALMKDTFMIAANNVNLGNLMMEVKNYAKGINYFKQALLILQRASIPLIEYNAYEGLALAYENNKQYQLALKYRTLYEEKKFDHINIERNRQIAELEKKYESKKMKLIYKI